MMNECIALILVPFNVNEPLSQEQEPWSKQEVLYLRFSPRTGLILFSFAAIVAVLPSPPAPSYTDRSFLSCERQTPALARAAQAVGAALARVGGARAVRQGQSE